ncbi:MAG TPA: hypothetical protein DEB24_03345 [Coriobacteriia bacterium]|nr:hypothetical protein [Coriobacteriia bacterium]
MTEKRQAAPRGARAALGVGLATLVTILVAVLLTCFSVLALVTARADLSLSNKATDAMVDYYTADLAAELWLAEVQDVLYSGQASVTSKLSAAGYRTGTSSSGQVTLSQSFVVDDVRSLDVELTIHDNATIEITKWQVTAEPQQ